jgi:hypothetical protein
MYGGPPVDQPSTHLTSKSTGWTTSPPWTYTETPTAAANETTTGTHSKQDKLPRGH